MEITAANVRLETDGLTDSACMQQFADL